MISRRADSQDGAGSVIANAQILDAEADLPQPGSNASGDRYNRAFMDQGVPYAPERAACERFSIRSESSPQSAA